MVSARLLLVNLAGQLLKPESESLLQIRTPQLGGGRGEGKREQGRAALAAKSGPRICVESETDTHRRPPMKLRHSHHHDPPERGKDLAATFVWVCQPMRPPGAAR